MAEFDVALIALGKLIGFFEGSGDDEGSVRWAWFADPVDQSLGTMPGQRARIGEMLRALLGSDTPAETFTTGHDWQPVVSIPEIDGGFGVTWSKPEDPLAIGVGARANNIGGEAVSLAILAKLLRIQNAEASHALGQVDFGGTFPVPDFLATGELTGAVDALANPAGVAVALTATAPGEDPCAFGYSTTAPTQPEVLGWDASRLAVYVLKAFVADRAGQGEVFFQRVLMHLFPMIGDDPANVIQPLPIVDEMGQDADFENWSDSVLPGDPGAQGALTFLWHLRALLTGNEDASFWPGSVFFPLIDGPIANGNPPQLSDALATPYPPQNPGAGAWVGVLTDPPDAFTLVLDLWSPASVRQRIPIAKWDGTDLTRPEVPFDASALQGFGGSVVTAEPDRVTLLKTTVSNAGPMNGDYEIALAFAGQRPGIVLKTPLIDITFPPTDPTQLAADLLSTTVQLASAGQDFGAVAAALADIAGGAIQGSAPSGEQLLGALVELASAATGGAGSDIAVELDDDFLITLDLAPGGLLKAGVSFGPVDSGGETPDLVIGTVTAGLTLAVTGNSNVLNGFDIGFENLRIGDRGTAGGIVETLIPDMSELPGFKFRLAYSETADPPVTITGGGKIPIQRTIGPLEIAALLVDLREESLAVGLDLGFELGPILVAAYELGLEVPFSDGGVTPFLHGLGLSMDTDMIKLGGFFAAIERTVDNVTLTDYLGGAVVSVSGYFELSAIGGYTQTPSGDPSLFIFASLVAPLGGPPWFFMTGVAGGFGLNRSLPDPALMIKHPFLKVMRGELAISDDPSTALTELADAFAVEEGQFWVAAGIQFISFGFITGRVVVAISFGHQFSLSILGMASFSLEPIAYIEIGILTTVDEEKFLLRASLSPNSYVLHPDIFSLQGDIALCAWYADPHKGDFLFSIGGYHPDFKRPEHYPELVRVGAKASLYDFVHLTVEVFFACTPQALMAGAKAALWAEFMGIAAGCEVYVDVLITWDPFFLRAGIGVVLWFEFFGRHEIGVHLDIYTPEFGGVATIDLAIVSFEVEFGADAPVPPPPSIAEFATKQLGLSATGFNAIGTRVPAFNTADEPGLLRVEFLSGRVGKAATEETEQQEGTDSSNPVHLGPEWSFLVRTRLPLDFVPQADVPPQPTAGGVVVSGKVHLPLCEKTKLPSRFTLSSPQLDDPDVADAIVRTWMTDYFPAATFGSEKLKGAQSGDQAVAKLDSKHPSVPRVEGMVVECGPEFPPPPIALTASLAEASNASERYPLPLADEPGISLSSVAEHLAFTGSSLLTPAMPGGRSRRASALADLRGRTHRPLSVLSKSAALLNTVKQSAGQAFTSAGTATAALPRIAPPLSPARAAELQPVSLTVLPMRSDHAARRRNLETVAAPSEYTEKSLTKPTGEPKLFRGTVTVPAARAQLIEFGGDGATAATLRMSGDQYVRTVAFDSDGAVLLDRHARGAGALTLPPATATTVLIGAGRAAAPAAAGIEPDTTLLAVGPRTFLAPGCVVRTLTPLPTPVDALDSAPGATLLGGSRRLTISFGPVKKTAVLVIRVIPTVEKPESVQRQLRWRAVGATLRDLVPVVGPDLASLTMAVHADGPWQLDIDLGPQWQLDGIALVPGGTDRLRAEIRRGGGRGLVDDSIPPDSRADTKVTVEARV